MILGLYQLQVYLNNEIQRGYIRLGSYSLSHFSFAAIPVDELVTVSVTSPADTVAKIRSSQESVDGCNEIEEGIKLDSDSTTAEDKDESNNIKDNTNTTVGNKNDGIETSETTSTNNDSEASQFSCARYNVTVVMYLLS